MHKTLLIFSLVCLACCPAAATNVLVNLSEQSDLRAGLFGPYDYSLLPMIQKSRLNVALLKIGVSLPAKPSQKENFLTWKSLFSSYNLLSHRTISTM